MDSTKDDMSIKDKTKGKATAMQQVQVFWKHFTDLSVLTSSRELSSESPVILAV
jgi:hypothetical protein